MAQELTHIIIGCKGAAGDPEVVGVLLSEQEFHVGVPEFDVSEGAADHKHLAAGREAAGHHAGLADRATSGNIRQLDFTQDAAQALRKWPSAQVHLVMGTYGELLKQIKMV